MPELHKQVNKPEADTELAINPVYFREEDDKIPRYRLSDQGVLPRTALQVVPPGWSRKPSS
jgi:hypothetical protein